MIDGFDTCDCDIFKGRYDGSLCNGKSDVDDAPKDSSVTSTSLNVTVIVLLISELAISKSDAKVT